MDKFRADRDPTGYNTLVFDCLDKKEVGRVVQEVMGVPFLAERRMIVVKNLISCKEAGLKEILKEKIEQNAIPDSNVLVVYESEEKYKAKADKELFELLKKEKFTECFSELEPREIRSWVLQEIKERGGEIDEAALRYLLNNYIGDLWGMSLLVDQLVSYSKKINEDAVKLFVSERVDDNIFNLVDAIVAGKKDSAFKMIQAQYRAGNDSGYVFAMILRQFKILLQLKDLEERGGRPDPKALGLHPYVVKKTLPTLSRYSMDDLKRAYNRLLDIDIQTKTGQGDQSLLLDIFVGSLA